jgi:hypothetical protein
MTGYLLSTTALIIVDSIFSCNATAEMTWIHTLLKELDMSSPTSDKLWCNNMSAMYLSSNPVYKLFSQCTMATSCDSDSHA